MNFKYRKLLPVALALHLAAIAILAFLSADRRLESDGEPKAAAAGSALPTLPLLQVNGGFKSIWENRRIHYDVSADPAELDLPHSSEATAFILVDLETRRALAERNSREAIPVASMSKMMTALLAFEAVEQRPDISLEMPIRVTDAAYRIGGSQVWLDPRETFSLRELMISIMVKSANDAAFLVAERLGEGDVDRFVEQMNRRAEALGMPDATFRNPHGLQTDGGNYATCEGLVYLAETLMQRPKALEWASLPVFIFRANADKPTRLDNHNRLTRTVEGVDGLKTGFTRRAGFCVTATCLRDDRRLVAVATGFSSAANRDAFVSALLDWGYAQVASRPE